MIKIVAVVAFIIWIVWRIALFCPRPSNVPQVVLDMEVLDTSIAVTKYKGAWDTNGSWGYCMELLLEWREEDRDGFIGLPKATKYYTVEELRQGGLWALYEYTGRSGGRIV